jgi:hypothetical protein
MFAFAGYSSDPSPIITHATHARAIKHPSTPPPTAIASNIASICIQSNTAFVPNYKYLSTFYF